ncbi:hypothetical protein SFRURICE_017519 [Spodoptera frugiperda]|nr:hypothetical protein SFRURICE_017519 [Spodoptera frugiperda]
MVKSGCTLHSGISCHNVHLCQHVAHRLSTSKSMDDVTNILHRTYEVYMRNNTDRKSQRTTVGQKARQADPLAWSEDPPFLRELYSLFPKKKCSSLICYIRESNQRPIIRQLHLRLFNE